MLKVPSVSAKYGIPEVGQNTCAGLVFGRSFFKNSRTARGHDQPGGMHGGMHLADDLGLWCNYGQLQRDFKKLYYEDSSGRSWGEGIPSYSGTNTRKGTPFSLRALSADRLQEGELGTALGLGRAFFWSAGPYRKSMEEG